MTLADSQDESLLSSQKDCTALRCTSITIFFGVTLLFGCLSSLTAQSVAKGKVFEVTSHGSAASAKLALSIAESTVAPAQKVFGRPRKKRKDRLKLHVFPSTTGFTQAVAKLPETVDSANLVSYASPKLAAAYVTVHPQSSVQALEELILPGPTARRVAHEAVRIYCYANLANHAALPVWLIEGAASTIAQDTLSARRMGLKDLCQDPFTATQIGVVIGLSKAGKLPTVGSVLGGRVNELSPSEQDAVHAVLFRYLWDGKHKSGFKRILKKAGTLQASPDLTRKLTRYAGTTLKVERVDTDFKAWLTDMSPTWIEVIPTLFSYKGDWVAAAYKNLNSVAWQRQAIGRKSWSLQGSFTIYDGPEKQLNLLLGRGPTGFLSIALDADFGATAFRFDSLTSKWSEIVSRELEGIKVAQSHAFVLSINGPNLVLSIDGEEVLSTAVEGVDLSGAWGLGAQAGSTGVWQKIVVK